MLNPTVLIIDDDAGMRKLYRIWLRGHYNVLEAEDDNAALQCLKTHSVDCILLDYLLPAISGLDFLQQSLLGNNKNIPVMILTEYGNEQVKADALKLGISDYFIKSHLTQKILIEAIENAIEKKYVRKNE